MTSRVAFALAFTLLSWASAFTAIRRSLEVFSPGALTLYRIAIAAATLLLVAKARGVLRWPDRADVPRVLLCGLLGGGGYHALLNFGQVTVEAGPASFLINTAPIFTVLLARMFLNERLRLLGYAGMLVSFLGVVLIILGRNGRLQFDPHALLVLAAAVSYSVFIVLQKALLEKYDVLAFSAIALATGALLSLVFTPDLVRDAPGANWQAHAMVIYLGIVPAGLGYLCWSYAQAKLTASRAVTFLYLTPVLATFIAWVWIGETPSVLALVGGGVVLVGVVIVNRFGRA